VETLPPREYGKANLPTVSAGNVSTTHEDKGRTRDKVAAAVGLGSGRTYEKAAKVWPAAIEIEKQEVKQRLTKLMAAYKMDYPEDERRRIKNAIKAHQEKLKKLEEAGH